MKINLSDTKTTCPFCGKEDFLAYSTENSNEPLPYRGYCLSCDSCITPLEYQFAQEQIIADYSNDYSSRVLKNAGAKYDEVPPVKMLKQEFITAGLNNNNLFKYLTTKFDRTTVKRVCNIYGLATHKVGSWYGAAIFYQYNKDDKRQSVKIIQYNEKSGHRITGNDLKDEGKDLLYQKPLIEQGKYCLFGRHLLNRPDSEGKPICIVESEKTAIIASIVYPEAIWMAAGSCYYLYDSKIDEGMRDRKIIIFPDVDVKYEPMYIGENGFKRCINWYMIKNQLCGGNNVIVSGYLERVLRDKCSGCPHNNICSSSPLFASFKNGEAKLESDPDLIHCPSDGPSYRGWDIADYILNTENEQRASFDELETPISEMDYKNIERIVSGIENLR